MRMMKRTVEDELLRLRKTTGLPLSLGTDSPDDEEEIISVLRKLELAYRERYDRLSFFRGVLKGETAGRELYASAARFHISSEELYMLCVAEVAEGAAEDAVSIIRQVFGGRPGDAVLTMSERHIAILKAVRRGESLSAEANARTMVDMLNTEAMVKASIGYADAPVLLAGLADIFRKCMLALEIGRIFYAGRNCFSSSRLGIGRLIHQLPEETCRMFLFEVLKGMKIEDLDDESVDLINAFFENNLNISETARKMFVHRNTLMYRLEKIHQATGLDLRSFDEALELKLAMMVSGYLKAMEKEKNT